MASRILVTGATGTVGTNVVRELSKRGVSLRACVHTASKADKIREANVEIFEVDYSDRSTIEAAFRGIESLYLLTPFVPGQVEIATLLVDIARKAGVRHIVKQSALGADSPSPITLGVLHRRAEVYIEESGIPYTFLRPNSFMQNFINFQGATIKAEGKIYLPLGEGKVSYIDARDIARVAAEVLTNSTPHTGKAYNLTGPEAIPAARVAQIFSNAIGRPVVYVDTPVEAARRSMLEAGLPDWTVNSLMELYRLDKTGGASGVTDAVEKITGSKPATFEKFASDHAHLLR